MSLSTPTLILPAEDKTPLNEAESAAALERAAELVESFALQSSAAALQALCSLSESNHPAETAREARILAGEMTGRSQMLDDEVSRYLSTRPSESPVVEILPGA